MLHLSITECKEVMDPRREKVKEVWEKFYRLVGIMSRTWRGSNYILYPVAGNTQPSSQNIQR
jgi:hypothetical protein